MAPIRYLIEKFDENNFIFLKIIWGIIKYNIGIANIGNKNIDLLLIWSFEHSIEE